MTCGHTVETCHMVDGISLISVVSYNKLVFLILAKIYYKIFESHVIMCVVM